MPDREGRGGTVRAKSQVLAQIRYRTERRKEEMTRRLYGFDGSWNYQREGDIGTLARMLVFSRILRFTVLHGVRFPKAERNEKGKIIGSPVTPRKSQVLVVQ